MVANYLIRAIIGPLSFLLKRPLTSLQKLFVILAFVANIQSWMKIIGMNQEEFFIEFQLAPTLTWPFYILKQHLPATLWSESIVAAAAVESLTRQGQVQVWPLWLREESRQSCSMSRQRTWSQPVHIVSHRRWRRASLSPSWDSRWLSSRWRTEKEMSQMFIFSPKIEGGQKQLFNPLAVPMDRMRGTTNFHLQIFCSDIWTKGKQHVDKTIR